MNVLSMVMTYLYIFFGIYGVIITLMNIELNKYITVGELIILVIFLPMTSFILFLSGIFYMLETGFDKLKKAISNKIVFDFRKEE